MSGSKNKGISTRSQLSLYSLKCSMQKLSKPAEISLRSPSTKKVFSKPFSPLRSFFLGFNRQLMRVFHPLFSKGSTSSNVTWPMCVSLPVPHFPALSFEGCKMSLPLITPSHFDAKSYQYVTSLIMFISITLGMGRMSSASSGPGHWSSSIELP